MVVASEHGYHYQYDLMKMCVNLRHVLCWTERNVVGWWLQVKKFVFDGSEDFLELAQVASHAHMQVLNERMGGGKWQEMTILYR